MSKKMAKCVGKLVNELESQQALARAKREQIAKEKGATLPKEEPKAQINELDIDILNDLEDQIHSLKEKFANDRNKLNKAVAELLEDAKAESKYTSHRIVSDHIKQEKLWNSINIYGTKSTMKKLTNKLLDLIDGDNSINSQYNVKATEYTNALKSALKLADPVVSGRTLDDAFKTGEYDLAIYKINDMISKGQELTPELANNKTAMELYKHIKKLNNLIYNDMRLSGLNVRYRNDFLLKRNYSAEKMIIDGDIAKSRQEYIDYMRDEVLDLKATFKEGADQAHMDKVIGEQFDEIIRYQRNDNMKDMIGMKSHVNQLKSRRFEFRDGEAEFNFNQKYGQGNLLAENLQSASDRAAKTFANVSTLGTRPDMAISAIKSRIADQFPAEAVTPEMTKLMAKVDLAVQETVAPIHSPTNMARKTIKLMRNMQAFTKLGSSVFTAAYDINSSALQYAVRTSKSQFEGYIKAFSTFMDVVGMSRQERLQLAQSLNVNLHFNDLAAVHGGNVGDFNSGFGKLDRFFMGAAKFTGIPHQTDLSRLTNAIMQTEALNHTASRAMKGQMSNLEKLAMQRYEFSDNDLKIISDHLGKADKHGVLTAHDILDPDKIDGSVFNSDPHVAQKMRQELYNKMAKYVDDAVHKGTPTPDARTKRQLFKVRRGQGVDPSDIANIVLQFKETAWKILNTNAEAMKDIHAAEGTKGVMRAGGEYMTLGLISYMGIEGLRATILNQKAPWEKVEDEEYRELFFDYLNKSSVAPVLTDFVGAATSPHRTQNLQTFALGPTASAASDVLKIPFSDDPSKQARKSLKHHVLPSTWIPLKAADRWLGDEEWITNRKIRK